MHTGGVGPAGEEAQDCGSGAERPRHHHGYGTEGIPADLSKHPVINELSLCLHQTQSDDIIHSALSVRIIQAFLICCQIFSEMTPRLV